NRSNSAFTVFENSFDNSFNVDMLYVLNLFGFDIVKCCAVAPVPADAVSELRRYATGINTRTGDIDSTTTDR
ncbi:hypothetical protein Q4S20_19330, partial [Morganella morganii]